MYKFIEMGMGRCIGGERWRRLGGWGGGDVAFEAHVARGDAECGGINFVMASTTLTT